jgi:hypothetical protein
MTTRTLPEGKELPVEPAVVEPLLRAALEGALEDLRSVPVGTRLATVYRSNEKGGIRTSEIEMPYYMRVFPDASNPAPTSAAARALTDYLWSRRQLKKTLSRDGDAEPTKEGWAASIWVDLILQPIWYLAVRAATHDLSVGNTPTPWRADRADVDDAVTELVGLLTGGDIIVTAICPLRAFSFPEDLGSFELEPGVCLEPWRGGPNQVTFLTRFHGEYHPDDDALWAATGALTARLTIRSTDDPVRVVADVINRFKWAVMMVSNTEVVPIERDAVLRSATRHVRTVLRRQSDSAAWGPYPKPLGWIEARAFQGFRPEEPVLRKVKEFLASLAQATALANGLGDALWAFGRSCVAPTPRDALLEAAIGLERLLVPRGPGESTYRFRLHGAAVLVDEAKAYEELNEIYKRRSDVAHGGASEPKTSKVTPTGPAPLQSSASRARFLLARAVHSIALMINSGELVLSSDRSLATAVGDLVRRRAVNPSSRAPPSQPSPVGDDRT